MFHKTPTECQRTTGRSNFPPPLNGLKTPFCGLVCQRRSHDGIAVANSAGSAAFYGADDNIRAGDFTRIGQRAQDDAESDVGAVTPTVSQMCKCPGAGTFDCQLYQETTCGTYGVPRAYVKVVVEEPWDSFSGLSLLPSVTVKREAYMRVR